MNFNRLRIEDEEEVKAEHYNTCTKENSTEIHDQRCTADFANHQQQLNTGCVPSPCRCQWIKLIIITSVVNMEVEMWLGNRETNKQTHR